MFLPRFSTFVVVGCCACSYTGLATETASEDFGCPQDKLVVTNPATRTYDARGCGKRQVYYCDYVHSDPGQADDHAEVTCRPLAAVNAAIENEEARLSACHDACESGESTCSEGCANDACRSMCRRVGTGCFEGCGFTVAR